jgi:hypothetical protein
MTRSYTICDTFIYYETPRKTIRRFDRLQDTSIECKTSRQTIRHVARLADTYRPKDKREDCT